MVVYNGRLWRSNCSDRHLLKHFVHDRFVQDIVVLDYEYMVGEIDFLGMAMELVS